MLTKNNNIMKKIISFLFFVIWVFPTYAEESVWIISFEPMRMEMKGLDDHVGDVFTYKKVWKQDPVSGDTTTNYYVNYDPINLNMDAKACFRGEINYRKNQWGIGFSGWFFNPYSKREGRVVTLQPDVGNFGDPNGAEYKNGVRMWDHTIEPAYNALEPSKDSPVNYSVEGDFYIWTLEAFGIKTISAKENSYIDFKFGLKMGTLDHKQELEQTQQEYYMWSSSMDLDKDIIYQSTSRANYGFMAGPVIGFEVNTRYKKIKISGFINQAILFGRVNYNCVFRNVEDTLYVDSNTGEIIDHDVNTFEFPFLKKESVSIPVTEFQFKVTYKMMENVFIGCAGFFSVWWNVPLAPKFSLPGDWYWAEGTGWKLRKDTLKFYGITPLLIEIFY